MTQIIALGIFVTDNATNTKGMLTHLQVELDRRMFYRFQPKGLNPENGQPVKGQWLVQDRLTDFKPKDLVDVELPLEVLGTQVEDLGSGFAGTAISLTYHINGCVHVNVQAKGVTKTGDMIDACDFDIRRLKGPAIKKLSKKEIAESIRDKPSPIETPRHQPRAL